MKKSILSISIWWTIRKTEYAVCDWLFQFSHCLGTAWCISFWGHCLKYCSPESHYSCWDEPDWKMTLLLWLQMKLCWQSLRVITETPAHSTGSEMTVPCPLMSVSWWGATAESTTWFNSLSTPYCEGPQQKVQPDSTACPHLTVLLKHSTTTAWQTLLLCRYLLR